MLLLKKMGCKSCKQSVLVTSCYDNARSGKNIVKDDESVMEYDMKKRKERLKSESCRASWRGVLETESFRLGNIKNYIEGEQVAAGWPEWLSAAAAEAVQGLVPLKGESFERLDKIGQGTYSTVYRARYLDTGMIVALKKVRFHNYEPESVRFMAREIFILRRLNHPNIIKLEGIITSKQSSSIYLVFEYMEHDISGLLGSPDIQFSEAQVKCYMKQLLTGLEHCHSRGVMHRDIKGANLLVNNEGVLKLADFGLANFCRAAKRNPLTSRVVTLWYRPPELLLGATDYGTFVDIWSVGCLFAEFFIGHPILRGRTEVEQLHKIFKLCGSPNENYWRKTKLSHATLYKPPQSYKSSVRVTFKELPNTAVSLIETLLSVEPKKRGTATSALESQYFTTEPFACAPSSLPKYQPSKEIDAKHHEETKRKQSQQRSRGPETTRKLTRNQNVSTFAPKNLPARNSFSYEIRGCGLDNGKGDSISRLQPRKVSIDSKEVASCLKNASPGDSSYSGPLEFSGSSGFAWRKQRVDNFSASSRWTSSSRDIKFEPSDAPNSSQNFDSRCHKNGEVLHGNRASSARYDSYKLAKRNSLLGGPDSVDASYGYHSEEVSQALSQIEELAKKRLISDLQDHKDEDDFSGPLTSQSRKVDKLVNQHERYIHQDVRMARLRGSGRQLDSRK